MSKPQLGLPAAKNGSIVLNVTTRWVTTSSKRATRWFSLAKCAKRCSGRTCSHSKRPTNIVRTVTTGMYWMPLPKKIVDCCISCDYDLRIFFDAFERAKIWNRLIDKIDKNGNAIMIINEWFCLLQLATSDGGCIFPNILAAMKPPQLPPLSTGSLNPVMRCPGSF